MDLKNLAQSLVHGKCLIKAPVTKEEWQHWVMEVGSGKAMSEF